MCGQRARLDRLDAHERIEVRHDRGVADPHDRLGDDRQPTLSLEFGTKVGRLIERVTEQERRPFPVGAHACAGIRECVPPGIRGPARQCRVGAVGALPRATHEGQAKVVVVTDSGTFLGGQRDQMALDGGQLSGAGRLDLGDRVFARSRGVGPTDRRVGASFAHCLAAPSAGSSMARHHLMAGVPWAMTFSRWDF